jgi:hypothetical protein
MIHCSTPALPPVLFQVTHRVLSFSRMTPFTHVVGYQHATAAFAGEVDSLLDAASYGSCWVVRSPGQ